MSNRIKIAILLTSFSMLTAQAQVTSAHTKGNVMAQFSTCHAPDLFKAIVANPKVFSSAPLGTLDAGKYIKVKSRDGMADGVDARIVFKNPITIDGMKVLGFYDSYDSTLAKISAELGSFLFWGFYVAGTPLEVSKQFNQTVPDANHLQTQVDGSFSKNEIRYITSPIGVWEKVGNESAGKIAKAGTVERALLLEQISNEDSKKMGFDTPVTTIFCTIQGSVDEELLKFERPDISK